MTPMLIMRVPTPSDQQKEPCPCPHHRRFTRSSLTWPLQPMPTSCPARVCWPRWRRCRIHANDGVCGIRSRRSWRWRSARSWPVVAHSPRSVSGPPMPPTRPLPHWRWVRTVRVDDPSHGAAAGWRRAGFRDWRLGRGAHRTACGHATGGGDRRQNGARLRQQQPARTAPTGRDRSPNRSRPRPGRCRAQDQRDHPILLLVRGHRQTSPMRL